MRSGTAPAQRSMGETFHGIVPNTSMAGVDVVEPVIRLGAGASLSRILTPRPFSGFTFSTRSFIRVQLVSPLLPFSVEASPLADLPCIPFLQGRHFFENSGGKCASHATS